ncbi:hypothetical protein COOONC_02248 [Cooperia oncophora]
MVITASESSHFESHHTSSYHEETRVTESHVEMSRSSEQHSHVDKYEDKSDAHPGYTQHYYQFSNDGRRDTNASAVSGATSVSVHSSVSNQTREQSYDLPPLEPFVPSSETHAEHKRGSTGSEHSESTVTVVSSHVQQAAEEVHTPVVSLLGILFEEI